MMIGAIPVEWAMFFTSFAGLAVLCVPSFLRRQSTSSEKTNKNKSEAFPAS